jgi:hypothetical protein
LHEWKSCKMQSAGKENVLPKMHRTASNEKLQISFHKTKCYIVDISFVKLRIREWIFVCNKTYLFISVFLRSIRAPDKMNLHMIHQDIDPAAQVQLSGTTIFAN